MLQIFTSESNNLGELGPLGLLYKNVDQATFKNPDSKMSEQLRTANQQLHEKAEAFKTGPYLTQVVPDWKTYQELLVWAFKSSARAEKVLEELEDLLKKHGRLVEELRARYVSELAGRQVVMRRVSKGMRVSPGLTRYTSWRINSAWSRLRC